jgi:hypothetical protein
LLYDELHRQQFALLMIEAATNTVVQLMKFGGDVRGCPCSIAVLPDGQHIFIKTEDGRILWYQPPFQDAKPQEVANTGSSEGSIFAGNNT